MKGSLAERQAALLRQNAELNEKVEAIEHRHQQQIESRPSSSTTDRRSTDQTTGVQQVVRGDAADPNDGEGGDVPRELAGKSAANRSRINMPMDLSASIDSFSSSGAVADTRTTRPSPSSNAIDETSSSTRTGSAKLKKQNSHPTFEGKVQEQANDQKVVAKRASSPVDKDDSAAEGLGAEATIRYQKARLRVLQDEVDSAVTRIKELEAAERALQNELEGLRAENAVVAKKAQQSQLLLDKQRELSTALESKQKILEGQLSAAQAQVDEVQRAEKQSAQQFRSKDVRLNRALEELEKVKAQLQEEKRSNGDTTVTKDAYDQLQRDNRKLEKQKNELLAAFKKQMKLIDLLKRQRIHMEAAKMLSFTEEEFSKTLELG